MRISDRSPDETGSFLPKNRKKSVEIFKKTLGFFCKNIETSKEKSAKIFKNQKFFRLARSKNAIDPGSAEIEKTLLPQGGSALKKPPAEGQNPRAEFPHHETLCYDIVSSLDKLDIDIVIDIDIDLDIGIEIDIGERGAAGGNAPFPIPGIMIYRDLCRLASKIAK